MNPAEQALTLLNGRDAALFLWYYDSTLDICFFSKGNKERKIITDIAWENKERKN